MKFSNFKSIKDQLLQGATTLDKPDYLGIWYGRSDGTAFDLRTSGENGLTIDVSDPRLPPDFKVHQQ